MTHPELNVEAFRRPLLDPESAIKKLGALHYLSSILLALAAFVYADHAARAADLPDDTRDSVRDLEFIDYAVPSALFFASAVITGGLGFGLRELVPSARRDTLGFSTLAATFDGFVLWHLSPFALHGIYGNWYLYLLDLGFRASSIVLLNLPRTAILFSDHDHSVIVREP